MFTGPPPKFHGTRDILRIRDRVGYRFVSKEFAKMMGTRNTAIYGAVPKGLVCSPCSDEQVARR